MVVTVWVLVGFMGISGAGGPIIVDNIATKDACETLKNSMDGDAGFRNGLPFKCHPVPKIISATR